MSASSVLWEGMRKILKLCQKNSFLSIKYEENFITGIRYGPLGSLLKQNIFKEWISSFLNNDVVKLFPVEVLKPRQQSFQKYSLSESSDRLLLEDISQYYSEAKTLAGNQLPFGLVSYGLCTQNVPTTKVCSENSNIMWNPETWSRGSMIFFCTHNKAMHWFYYWQRQRYLWWRKFSNVPSQFRMSDITQTVSGGQEMSLMLECPWGTEKIETIHLAENGYFDSLNQMNSDPKDSDFASDSNTAPIVITCEMEIDLAVFAYISNSFVRKKRNGELQSMFQFHSKLAPYKVSISLNGEDTNLVKKLNDVASHLSKSLMKNGISVFPNPDQKTRTLLDHQFTKFDEIGLPYSIILDEAFLKNGIAGLRSRDTTLQEQVHVTEIVDKLVKYLKISSTPVS